MPQDIREELLQTERRLLTLLHEHTAQQERAIEALRSTVNSVISELPTLRVQLHSIQERLDGQESTAARRFDESTGVLHELTATVHEIKIQRAQHEGGVKLAGMLWQAMLALAGLTFAAAQLLPYFFPHVTIGQTGG